MKVICILLGVALGAVVTNILWLSSAMPQPRASLIILAGMLFAASLAALKYDW